MVNAPEITQTAIVTGAASGIGEACAALLVDRGWSVHGWDLATGEIPGVRWSRVDVSDHTSVGAAAAEVPVTHALVNCAGIGLHGSAEHMDPASFARVIATNLNGTFFTSRALFDALAAGAGTVINIASIVGHRAGPRRAAYATSKAAVLSLTQVLATDWSAYGIRVVAVSPGYVNTPMVAHSLASGALDRATIYDRTPAGRLAEPNELAQVIYELLQPTFSLVNGSAVLVDGGWLANGGY